MTKKAAKKAAAKKKAAKKAPSKAAGTKGDLQAIKDLGTANDKLKAELHKTIVGMDNVIEETLIAIFSKGHALLEGVPGLAKTLLVSSIAECLSLSFKRIQFTPDLMPSDITGSEVLQDDPISGKRQFQFSKGPIFANMILADEINRTPPKTQAALLEAMQEKQVSAGGEDYNLDAPFFVLATQNPLEQEGTYSLPEAQLDRFMFKIHVDYPTFQEEIDIMDSVTSGASQALTSVLKKVEILKLQDVVSRVKVTPHLYQYVATLVRNTRPDEDNNIDAVRDYVSWGCGPRACINLITGAKARAALNGNIHVSLDDIKALAKPVLRHRMGLNFLAQSDGETTDSIIDQLIDVTPEGEELHGAA
jgi:MoxR-like ATPase